MNKILILSLLLSCKTVFAQPKRKAFAFSIGPGVVAKTNNRHDNQYDKSDKPTNISFIPFVRLKLGPISLSGGGISLNLARVSFVSPYLILKRAGHKYYGIDMDKRKGSWFFGGGIRIPFLKAEFIKDIQSRSEGSITNLDLSKRMSFGKTITIIPGLGFSFRNSQYNNYYYGVRSHEVTSSRSVYMADSSWAYSLSVLGSYKFSDKLSSTVIIKHTTLGDEITDSPTTRTDKEQSLILGISYDIL